MQRIQRCGKPGTWQSGRRCSCWIRIPIPSARALNCDDTRQDDVGQQAMPARLAGPPTQCGEEQHQAHQRQTAEQITASNYGQIPLQIHRAHDYCSLTFSGVIAVLVCKKSCSPSNPVIPAVLRGKPCFVPYRTHLSDHNSPFS